MAPLSDELDPDSTIGRTSTPELRARDLTSNRSTCSGKQRHPLCRPPRGSQSASRTMDARDKQALGKRSRGRSRASFYNDVRPHQALGYRTPRETFEAAPTCGYVDNASALTTSPQEPQLQQNDAINNQNVLCSFAAPIARVGGFATGESLS